MSDLIRDLGRGEAAVERHRGRAQVCGGKVRVEEEQPVAAHDRNPIASPYPAFRQAGSDAVDPVTQLAVSESRAAHDLDRGAVGVKLSVALEQVDYAHCWRHS
jgi:hypothetical protein